MEKGKEIKTGIEIKEKFKHTDLKWKEVNF